MSTAFNPTARWSEWMAWFLGRPAVTAQPARAARRARSAALGAPEHRLAAGGTLTVLQPQGSEVVCLNGTLWITHDGEETDRIVVAGKPYVARHTTTMLVHAMGESRFIVIGPRD